jgi:hypothetical protein
MNPVGDETLPAATHRWDVETGEEAASEPAARDCNGVASCACDQKRSSMPAVIVVPCMRNVSI